MVHWWLLELHCSCFSSMIFNFNQCLWFLKCFTCSLGITTYELYAFTILSKPDFYSYQLSLPNLMQPFYFFTFFGIQACIPFWPSTLIFVPTPPCSEDLAQPSSAPSSFQTQDTRATCHYHPMPDHFLGFTVYRNGLLTFWIVSHGMEHHVIIRKYPRIWPYHWKAVIDDAAEDVLAEGITLRNSCSDILERYYWRSNHVSLPLHEESLPSSDFIFTQWCPPISILANLLHVRLG